MKLSGVVAVGNGSFSRFAAARPGGEMSNRLEVQMTLMLIEDIAQQLHVAPSTCREWCRRGLFPNIRYPGTRRILIPSDWAEEFVTTGCELRTVSLADGGRIVQPCASRRARSSGR